MAEREEEKVDFIPVKDEDIMAERTAMWDRFNQGTVIGIVVTAVILVLLAIFLA